MSTAMPLAGLNILIVEDEYFVADELAFVLSAAGANVIGPASSIKEATELLDRDTPIHAAILDINLQDEMVFPVADKLAALGVPFVFSTGYDRDVIPERHRGAIRIEKPADPEKVVRSLATVAAKR